MKKLLVLALSFFTIFTLFSCGTEEVKDEPLKAVENILVQRGIITFDFDSEATYKLKIYDSENTFVCNQEITSGFDLTSILEDGEYKGVITYTKGDKTSESTSKFDIHIGYEKVDVKLIKEFKGLDLCDSDYVNLSGRTFYDEKTGRQFFYYTASGFKVTFEGTELKASFYTKNKKDANANYARLVILVDGEVYPDEGHTIILDKSDKTYTLVNGLEKGIHTVEVLKRTESSDNTTAVTSIKTDGHFETPQADKQKRILLIGASGSAGHGSIGGSSEGQSASNSDGLRAFPYLTARMYDTEIDEINCSGWGVLWGWNDQSGANNMPKAFTRVGITVNGGLTSTQYDYTKDSYDLIILNLGMNDFNAKIKSITDATTKANDIAKYEAAVESFYTLLCNTYSCPIVILHTANDNKNAEGYYNEPIAKKVNQAMGTTRITPIIIPANGANGAAYGGNSHANVQTHIWTADLIAEFIDENLQWTKVRNNITYSSTRDLKEINVVKQSDAIYG